SPAACVSRKCLTRTGRPKPDSTGYYTCIMNSSTASPLLLRLNRGLMMAALVILLFSLLVYVVYATNLIRFPFDYDQGEGFELVDTILFSQGKWPYQNTEVYPFYSSNYPPLFHIISAPFVWVFGPA